MNLRSAIAEDIQKIVSLRMHSPPQWIPWTIPQHAALDPSTQRLAAIAIRKATTAHGVNCGGTDAMRLWEEVDRGAVVGAAVHSPIALSKARVTVIPSIAAHGLHLLSAGARA